MSAEIIAFPNSGYEPEKSEFPINWPYTVAGVPVNPPRSRQQYQELCKQFLTPENYTDFLIAVMDRDAYDAMEETITNLVDNYYAFKK